MNLRLERAISGLMSTVASLHSKSFILNIDFDGYIDHRQNTGVDTEGDYRTKTSGLDFITERYESSAWVEKAAVEA